MNDTKNFKASEFACKHCGENKIDQRVIDLAQAIRDELGQAVRVNSGYRCPVHNANVGGVKGSNHTKGLAADLSCSAGAAAIWDALHRLHAAGKIPQLGYAIKYRKKNFVHVDVVKRASGNMWELRA